MGTPTSFTARRPNASNLGTFELPPPPLAGLQQKYPAHSYAQPAPVATTLTSVGNLLTPPSNSSSDGMSPSSSIAPSSGSLSNHGSVPPYTPSSMWPPPSTSSYSSFQTSAPQHSFSQGRALFSPSLNSIVRGSHSPTASESLPPPPYEIQQYSSSLPMSAPSLPALQHHQQMIGTAMVGGQPPASQSSPVHPQEAFARPPPTPTYTSQPASYSTGPPPQHHSPVSAGGPLAKSSPVNQFGSIPPLQSQSWTSMYGSTHRPYFPGNAGVLPPGGAFSNVSNPNGQLSLVGGMSHQMGMPLNSGHMAQMQHLYGAQAGHPNPANDRPFRCDQCPQSFNRNHDLKRHKRIHLAVKPFPCGHCDKSFSRKDALKVSLRDRPRPH